LAGTFYMEWRGGHSGWEWAANHKDFETTNRKGEFGASKKLLQRRGAGVKE